MSVKIGSEAIKSLYVGEQKIVRAYVGENLVFSEKRGPSVDNLKWNLASMSKTANWEGIVRGSDKFVIGIRTSGKAGAYSLDGVTWSDTSYSTSGNYSVFAYGNNRYIAYMANGTKGVYSADGVSFTGFTPNVVNTVFGLAYGKGVFVLVFYSGSSNAIYYSSDGITWKTAKLPASGNNGYKYNVHFLNDRFFAIGRKVLLYSMDGITWYSCDGALGLGNAHAMAFNGEIYVAADSAGNTIYSRDGIAWMSGNAIASPENAASWKYMAYGAGIFVLLGDTSNYAACSTDGLTWKTVRLPEGASTCRGLAYGAGRFVAPIYNSDKILYSDLLEDVSSG